MWLAGASILRGWTLAEAGERAAGGLEIRRGIDEWRATGAEYMVPYFLALSSRVELGAGRPEAALKLLEEARARVERTGERWFSAEILRLEGEANLALGRDRLARAKACFARALETAAGQGARLWELRAALSLARVEADDAGLRGRLGRLCATFGDDSGPLPELEAARALAPTAGLVTQVS